MSEKILVTGGAGFIGSYVVEQLLEAGNEVVVYDALVEQVHQGAGPLFVPEAAEFVYADVVDRDSLASVLSRVDSVIHLAAEVGVGQSMYEISRYVEANTMGTANLLDILVNDRLDVRRVVVASSMSVYGEGAYTCHEHGEVHPGLRGGEQLAHHRWDPMCPMCGLPVDPIPTAEGKPLRPTSVYAISKMDQELLCLSVAAAYDFDAVALRFFNTYGPRQALSNPYTGVAAIFSSRLLNGRAPLAFEDGAQLRDFVHVTDVARAVVASLDAPRAAGQAINVGVGDPLTVKDVALALAHDLGVDLEPEITETSRAGDIRHCYADMTLAREVLDFAPQVGFSDGVRELIGWVQQQTAHDMVEHARAELTSRGLAH